MTTSVQVPFIVHSPPPQPRRHRASRGLLACNFMALYNRWWWHMKPEPVKNRGNKLVEAMATSKFVCQDKVGWWQGRFQRKKKTQYITLSNCNNKMCENRCCFLNLNERPNSFCYSSPPENFFLFFVVTSPYFRLNYFLCCYTIIIIPYVLPRCFLRYTIFLELGKWMEETWKARLEV